MDLPTFRTRAPEFATAPDGLVQAMLDEAALELTTVGDWGALYDIAHRLLASHKLWASPFGATMRLDGGGSGGDKEPESRYAVQLADLHTKAFLRAMVI